MGGFVGWFLTRIVYENRFYDFLYKTEDKVLKTYPEPEDEDDFKEEAYKEWDIQRRIRDEVQRCGQYLKLYPQFDD